MKLRYLFQFGLQKLIYLFYQQVNPMAALLPCAFASKYLFHHHIERDELKVIQCAINVNKA